MATVSNLKLSDHQRASKKSGGCAKCSLGLVTHCSWCGADGPTKEALVEHLNLGCGYSQVEALEVAGTIPLGLNPYRPV